MTLPPSWSTMVKLVSFDLSYNSLSGQLPDSYSSLTTLTSLDVDENYLTGTLPSSWGGALPGLKDLNLNFNGIGGQLPASWASRGNLTSLVAGSNAFVGTLPPQWASLTKVSDTRPPHTSISSHYNCPPHTLIRSRNLHCQATPFRGPCPRPGAQWPALRTSSSASESGGVWSVFLNEARVYYVQLSEP